VSYRGFPPPLSFRARSATTRNLYEPATVSRHFPNSRSLAALGMTAEEEARDDTGKVVPFRGPPLFCHSEERLFFVIPRSASDEESLRVCHRLPPLSQLQIPLCARDDSGRRGSEFQAGEEVRNSKREKRLGMTRGKWCHSGERPFSVIPKSAPCLSFRGAPATRNLSRKITTPCSSPPIQGFSLR
jgi:hypothetical protein